MKVIGRFLTAELIWVVGIFVLMIPVELLDNDPPAAMQLVTWLARAISLAAFPAGIAIAPVVLGDTPSWRALAHAVAAASVVAILVFVLNGFVAPVVTGHSLAQLAALMNDTRESWEMRNDAGWRFYVILLSPLIAFLHALIGLQVGAWASRAFGPTLRRALYWAVGLGLVVSGYAVFDTTYETIVLHTAAQVSRSAFYIVLVPAFLCGGLALPTLALLRPGGAARARFRGRTLERTDA